MTSVPPPTATLTQPEPQQIVLAGSWTAVGLGRMEQDAASLKVPTGHPVVADGAQVDALDSAGAWLVQTLLQRLQGEGGAASLQGLRPQFKNLMESVAAHLNAQAGRPAAASPLPAGPVHRLGKQTVDAATQALAVLTMVGEVAAAAATCVRHPSRMRWRPVLFNIRTAGFDALPIVGLLAFLLGIVVAYQSANQLRQFGANIFIVDVVGLSMLREFAPMMTAIIIAGRSGSAYAAQIGTMAVTEEIDAMRTLGIAPLELLVLPKLIALLIALPLLTFFADVMGVLGGMLMARSQLGVGFAEFGDRLVKAVSVTDFLVGLGKAPVFALIIVVIGCFQGLQTRGGADSVGRQTTRSVVHSIFLVIVADALFSVIFSALDL